MFLQSIYDRNWYQRHQKYRDISRDEPHQKRTVLKEKHLVFKESIFETAFVRFACFKSRNIGNIGWQSVHLNGFNHHGGSWYVLYVYEYTCIYDYICIYWVVPLPSNSGNEGLVRDSLLKMVHNPGGHYYWEGGPPNVSMGFFLTSQWFFDSSPQNVTLTHF